MKTPLKHFYFLTQSLDNASDLIMGDGQLIDESDREAQLEIIEMINEITANSRKVYRDNSIRVYIYNDDFVLEIIPASRDIEGRKVPIVCMGPLAARSDTEPANSLLFFVRAIKWKLPDDYAEHINNAMKQATEGKSATDLEEHFESNGQNISILKLLRRLTLDVAPITLIMAIVTAGLLVALLVIYFMVVSTK